MEIEFLRDVRLEDETVWLTQSGMAVLFQITKQNVSLHLKNVYNENELAREATVKENLTVQKAGSRAFERRIDYYNLDNPAPENRNATSRRYYYYLCYIHA